MQLSRPLPRVKDDTEEDETDDSKNLDDGEPKLHLTVDARSSAVDGDGDDEADSDPGSRVDVGRPVTNQDSGSRELSGEYDRPVVP